MRREEQEPDEALVTPDIAALADAVRGRDTPGREGEARALAAFREARDAGTHARTGRGRRRDDWRPAAGRRRAGSSWKAVLGSIAATAALGGVALAVGVVPVPFDRGGDPVSPVPTGDTPRSPAEPPAGLPVPGTTQEQRPRPTAPSASARGPADPGLVGLCRARSTGNGDRTGQALRRLAEAAGGADGVDEFCARTLEESGTGEEPPESAKPSKEPKPSKPSREPKAAKSPTSSQPPVPSKSPRPSNSPKAAEPTRTAKATKAG
ncbi:hypothetical protein ACFPN0_02235 [Kitasatospora cinereorecta]